MTKVKIFAEQRIIDVSDEEADELVNAGQAERVLKPKVSLHKATLPRYKTPED